MVLTKIEYLKFAQFLDELPEYGNSPNGYSLIEYASVRNHLDNYYKG